MTENYIDRLLDDSTVTEVTLNQEYADADSYKAKFIEAKLYVEDLQKEKDATSRTVNNASAVQFNAKRGYSLPAMELKMFGGEIRQWMPFWSCFKKIYEDTRIVKEDKSQYLLQAMTPESRAVQLVASYSPTEENYDNVIASLKDRFGRDELQIEMIVNSEKNMDVSVLYDKFLTHLRSLEVLGVTTDKFAAMLFPLIESALSEDILRVWQRSTVNYLDENARSDEAEKVDI